MAKPSTYTVNIVHKQPDGSHVLAKTMKFEQIRNKDGTYSSTLLSSVDHISLEEQLEYEKKMMKNVGRMMSDYYAGKAAVH